MAEQSVPQVDDQSPTEHTGYRWRVVVRDSAYLAENHAKKDLAALHNHLHIFLPFFFRHTALHSWERQASDWMTVGLLCSSM